MAKTVTDEIVDKVMGEVKAAPVHPDSQTQGVVFGEEHMNDEFALMMARRIIPELSKDLPESQERVLHVEWDITPETLDQIEQYMKTGDPDIRDALVKANYNIAGRDMRPVHQAWGELLDSARKHGFKIKPFDEDGVSLDKYYNEVAKELGKEVRDLTSEEQDIAGDRRVADSNPLMIKNIQGNTPDGAFSLVIVGDNHASKVNDLPENLGYSYLRFVESRVFPDIKEGTYGADLDVQLVNMQIASDFVLENLQNIGLDLLPHYLDDINVPEWLSDENKEFMNALHDEMRQASLMLNTEQYDAAIEKIDHARGMISDRYTGEQIAGDDYLKSLTDILDVGRGVVVSERPEVEVKQEVVNTNQETPFLSTPGL